jgi:hypothetical protein
MSIFSKLIYMGETYKLDFFRIVYAWASHISEDNAHVKCKDNWP